jgi:hypothetical protein
LDKPAVVGISFATSIVGILLLSYCLYVSWYGRWGLPKLKRVSATVCSVGFVILKSGNVQEYSLALCHVTHQHLMLVVVACRHIHIGAVTCGLSSSHPAAAVGRPVAGL